MSIGLLNLYSTRNLGDAAIYAALARMSPDGRVSGHLHESSGTRIDGLDLTRSTAHCQAFVSVGGDIFNNARPNFVTRRFLSNVKALRARPDATMLFGQSIPRSCRGPAFLYLASTLKKLSKVVVRDVESHKRLTAAGVKAVLSYDTAFALEAQAQTQPAARRLFEEAGLQPERTALISLRNQSKLYGETEGDRQLTEIAQSLAARGHQIGLLVQADGDAADTDRALAMHISSHVPAARIIDPFKVTEGEPWSVMTAVLGLANIVVAVRYHAAILRMVEGRLPFVLHYSNKGADLCQRLDVNGARFGESAGSDLIAAIERSAASAFDARPLREDVKASFSAGLKAIAA